MNLRRVHPIELKKIYVDNLAEWVEVPVFDQDEVLKLVNEIDWEDLDMRTYKKTMVEYWPGLPASVKAKSKNPAVRDELYNLLVHENWGLAPSALISDQQYTEIEKINVTTWFATGGKTGKKPDVI